MLNWIKRRRHNHSGQEKKTNSQPIKYAQSPIANAIYALFQEQKALEARNNSQQKKNYSIQKWTLRWLAIYTVITGVIAYLSLRQLQSIDGQAIYLNGQLNALEGQTEAAKILAETMREELVAGQRAWLGPTDALIDKTPILNEPLTMTVSYANTGRKPGLNVQRYLLNHILDHDLVKGGKASPVIENDAAVCRLAQPVENGLAAWPTTSANIFTLSQKIEKSGIENSIRSGRNLLVVTGCFAYLTYGKVRHTAFCFYYEPGVGQIAHLAICQVGNYAD